MERTKECCGWLGWAAMAGIDEHGRRIVRPVDHRSETTTKSEHVNSGGPGHRAGDELDCSRTVSSVLAEHPATATVFHRFGVDLCCGASLTIEQAVLALGLSRHALCDALREAAAAA